MSSAVKAECRANLLRISFTVSEAVSRFNSCSSNPSSVFSYTPESRPITAAGTAIQTAVNGKKELILAEKEAAARDSAKKRTGNK